MTAVYLQSHNYDEAILPPHYKYSIMRGLSRILFMFGPMIFRAASKYYNKYQAKKQQEDFAQKPHNEAEGKMDPDKGTYKNKDLV